MRRFVLILLPLIAGCYSYALIEPGTAQPGTDVRAHISAQAAEKLAPLLGTSSADNRMVAGRLIEIGPSSMIVEVPTIVPADGGTSVQTLNQRVSIERTNLIGMEIRTLDPVRTGVLAAGVALVVGGAAYKAFKGEGSSEGLPRGSGTELRIPLFRIVR